MKLKTIYGLAVSTLLLVALVLGATLKDITVSQITYDKLTDLSTDQDTTAEQMAGETLDQLFTEQQLKETQEIFRRKMYNLSNDVPKMKLVINYIDGLGD